MRVTMPVHIHNILTGKSLTFKPKTWRFAALIWLGAEFPPIILLRVMNGYVIIDGAYRLAAYKLLRRKKIIADVGIPEDPNPYTDLRHRSGPFVTPQSQADGYAEPTSYKD